MNRYIYCFILGMLCLTSSMAYAEEGQSNNGSSDLAIASTILSLGRDVRSQLVEINAKQNTEELKVLVPNIGDSFDAVGDAYKASTLRLIARDKIYTSRPMPFKSNFLDMYRTRVGSSFIATYQAEHFDKMYADYVSGKATIGSQTNPYRGTSASAQAEFYKKFIGYFCIVGTPNAPAGCGANNGGGESLGGNLADTLVGETTWSSNKLAVAIDFMRGYFGKIPDKLDLSRAQEGQYVALQAENAQTSLRMAILHRLAARRMALKPDGAAGKSSDGFVRQMFGIFADRQKVMSRDPRTACRPRANQVAFTEDEKRLCSMLNNSGQASQAVLDRYSQYDFYMDPEFLGMIYKPEYPSRGSLDRMEVIMRAQQVAQDYQFLRDLQAYTLLRAVKVSQ